MSQNPFSPHSPAPPESFIDRERVIDLIFDHIRSPQRGNVAISGGLGMGKTSLLRYISDPKVAGGQGLTAPDTLLIYLDAQSVTPFSAERFWRRVARLAVRVEQADLEAPTERLLGRDDFDVIDLEEYLDDLADRGIGLVLLLDEFEWALQTDSPEAEAESRHFLAQMVSLARRSPRSLGLVVATERPLPEATRVIESWRGSPFATVFTSAVLQALDRGSCDRLIEQALASTSIRFDEAECARLHQLSEGRPASLQVAAFSLFRGRERKLRGNALWAPVEEAVRNSIPQKTAPSSPPARAEGVSTADAETAVTLAPHNGQARHRSPDEGIWLDRSTGEVSVNGRRVASLTALEFSLLKLLYASPGRLCSKADIIGQVWGEEFLGEVDDSRVEKLISRLRRKVEPMPGRPQHIRTVRGRGYRYVP